MRDSIEAVQDYPINSRKYVPILDQLSDEPQPISMPEQKYSINSDALLR